jgi:Fe2+ transport system protein FeoA
MPAPVHFELNGKRLTLREWALEPECLAKGLTYGVLRNRRCAGWPMPELLTLQRGAHYKAVHGRAYGVSISHALAYEDDVEAQRFVDEHPNGATLDEVGVALGLSRERVRQIEADAVANLVRRLRLVGITRDELLELFASREAA